MEELSFRHGMPHRAMSPTIRDVMAIGFRHRRLIVVSFLATFLGAVLAVYLGGNTYEAQMRILVRRDRVDPVVTPDANGGERLVTQMVVSEEEMNSEVELMKSKDLLEKVVTTCGLSTPKPHFWSKWVPWLGTQDYERIPKAVRRLGQDLKIDPVRKSNLIEVSYASDNPELSARVLITLGGLYLAKHQAVNRPPGEFAFFQEQTEQYRKGLAEAEGKLADFAGKEGSVAAQTERDINVQKVNELEVSLKQTQATIAATTERIRALESQLATTPPRLSTQVRTSDNPALMEQLKSKLLTLQLKRTELLGKFAPTYPLVKEVEAEIEQTRVAIATEEKSPVREGTTDQNPTYQWLSGELARAKAELPTLQANAAATTQQVRGYREKILVLDKKGMEQQELTRTAKAQEENYLLYMKKREEARIADALDKNRISNVVIEEAATVPVLPVHSAWLLIFVGGLLATLVSAGSAFVADFLDPSFRTPDEVLEYLDVPVLAALPENVNSAMTALPPTSE